MRKKSLLMMSMMLIGISWTSIAQSPADREKIVSRYDQSALQQVKSQIDKKIIQQRSELEQYAKTNNIPLRKELKDGTLIELQYIDPVTGAPIYYSTYNVAAARSTRTNFLHNNGGLGLNVEGQNMTAYVWDGGLARATHQEYDGPGGNNRFSIGDNSSTLNYHAAHVTGTIMAYGAVASAKGMAPRALAVGHDWNNDKSEATSQAANGMLLSNHSYGYRSDLVPDYYFGAYITESRDWDQIMYNAPYYLMVVAAGNDGNANSYNGSPLGGNSSYDKLTGHSTSKNNLVVANAQDANINSSGDLISVSINSSSSEGPTDDLRIKPDITGNGTGVYSTYESSDTAYNSITGTSMASPNVTGSLLLLQQHYNQLNGNYMRAASLKGLALHTADDAGATGPDPIFGWGLMNTKRAAELISNDGVGSEISELTLTNGQTYEITVNSDGVNDLMASISWTDLPGTATTATNSNTARLVNDLDIRVIKSSTTYEPWRLTGVTTNGLGDNTRDPYERISVANASGTYTIRVTHKGSLVGGSQNYTLILSGVSQQVQNCVATVPTGLNLTGAGATEASLAWNAVTGATYVVRFRESGTSTWTTGTINGTTATLTGLQTLTDYEAQVRSVCSDGSQSNYSSSINFNTTNVAYCSSNGNNVSDEYIGRVQFNSIDQASGAGSGGYTDYTGTSTNVSAGNSYTLTVTPTWTGTVYSEGYAAWIDWNQDGDFNDAGEQVWSLGATSNTPVSGTVSVPSGATPGATRMRVSMKYNGTPTACESFEYGEVEDYTVIVGAGDSQAPSVPTGLSVSNITQDAANVSWTASSDNVGVEEYEVSLNGNVLGTVQGTAANLTGLVANTSYSVRVAARDAAGNTSALSQAATFNTLPEASSGCTATASLPYAQGWNSSLGNWSQDSNDDFDWTRRTGGTPSSNTGPSSAIEGSHYVYMESSAPNNNVDTARLISPCIDLGNDAATLTFSYHMYGANTMGSLRVDISTDGGSSWTQLWSRSGNQGNSWQTATVDLSGFVSTSVQIRLNGTTGTTWQGDMAVDNLSISTGPADPCAGVAAWNSGTSYAVGDRVTYNGFLYVRTSSGWTNLGPCGTTNSYVAQDDSFGPPLNAEFKLYPNPVTDGILNINHSLGNEATYGILNLQGQMIRTGSLTSKMDVSDLSTGVYLLQVKAGNEVMTKRFIIE